MYATSSDAGMRGTMISAALPLLGAVAGAAIMMRAAGGEGYAKKMQVIYLMMGVCSMYGFIGALVIHTNLFKDPSFMPGNAAYAAGLVNGFSSGLAALSMGVLGKTVATCLSQQPRLFVAAVLIMIFIEATALYGLIVGLVTMSYADVTRVDMELKAVLGFASVDVLANAGASFGSMVSGIAIMQIGIERPHMVMKGMIAVVMSGVTAIYGLITTIIDANPVMSWPPAGDDSIAGLLYLVSSIGLSYVGYYGLKDWAQNLSNFASLILKLMMCETVGLIGLIVGLVKKHPQTIQPLELYEAEPLILIGKGFPNYALLIFASVIFFIPLLGACRHSQRSLEFPLLD